MTSWVLEGSVTKIGRVALRHLALSVTMLTACAHPTPPPATTAQAPAAFEPAPTPHTRPLPRSSTVGALEIPLPPKMPLGTGAVPVGGGGVRGSVVTGLRESF